MKQQHSSARALVAGGAGFLGAHLCKRLLDQGLEVICLDSFTTGTRGNIRAMREIPGFQFIEHDICEPLRIGDIVEEVYNLACAASPPLYQADPAHTMLTNVVGTHHLLQLAQAHGARFLLASTSEVYGDPEVHPQPEIYRGNVSCTGPRACYDEGKRAAEALSFDFLRLGRVDARVARIFNTYGPGMRTDDGRIVSNLVNQALGGEPLTLYGDGEQTRSFCYVDDLIEGLVKLMRIEQNPHGPVNLGNPNELSVNQLADLVQTLTGSSSAIERLELPQDDPSRRRPDISLARTLLDWQPETSLEQGLKVTIDWFRRSRPQRQADHHWNEPGLRRAQSG